MVLMHPLLPLTELKALADLGGYGLFLPHDQCAPPPFTEKNQQIVIETFPKFPAE